MFWATTEPLPFNAEIIFPEPALNDPAEPLLLPTTMLLIRLKVQYIFEYNAEPDQSSPDAS